MRVVKLKLGLLSIVAGAFISTGMVGLSNIAPANATTFQVDAVKTEYLDQPVAVNGGEEKILMSLRNISLRDTLRALSKRAGFNIMLDETVEGDISVDLNNVTINQALETIKDYANLLYVQDDKTLIVSGKGSELATSINQQISQMITVKYVNASLIAQVLNSTIFASESSASGGEKGGDQKATAEYRTNSVVIVGTDNDIRLAEDMVKILDVPRESKTFKINHASVVEVTQLLQATVFNDGVAPYNGGGAGSSGGGDGITASPTPVSINTESYVEGSGSSEVEGASSDGGGGQGQDFTLRSRNLNQKEIKISPEGPVLIPDTRSSTITIMGTVEQIALAEAVIPTLDQKLPQVAMETSLIEINDEFAREMGSRWGQQSGQWRTGFNNTNAPSRPTAGSSNYQRLTDLTVVDTTVTPPVETTLTNALGVLGNVIGIPSISTDGQPMGSVAFSTAPIDRSLNFLYQIDMMLSRNKAKLLANPTVITMHNTEAVISITQEVIRRTTVTRDATGFTQTQSEIGEAGIILNILPKVTGDGYINLRIRPSVSTIADVIRRGDSVTTLLRRKDFAVQDARVANGQTLAIGGLIEERTSKEHYKIPGLGDMPLIGALFRANNRGKERVELIMLLTPNVLEDSQPIASSFTTKPLVEISTNLEEYNKKVASKKSSVPLPSSSIGESEPAEVKPLNEQHNFVPIEPPENNYQIKSLEKPETKVNAYTIDDVMNEFGIKNVEINPDKKINKSEIDELLNEYLPQGSK